MDKNTEHLLTSVPEAFLIAFPEHLPLLLSGVVVNSNGTLNIETYHVHLYCILYIHSIYTHSHI